MNQNPIGNGCYIVAELNEFFRSGFFESPLGYDNVDWFVVEVLKLKTEKTFSFKNTKKAIKMSEEEGEHFERTFLINLKTIVNYQLDITVRHIANVI